MKHFRILALSILLFISLLSACSPATTREVQEAEPQEGISEPENTPPSELENTPTPAPLQNSVGQQPQEESSNPIPRQLTEKAKADLAVNLNIEVDQIQVVETRAVDWPDASLGCPQPDTTYAQVITPGYWMLLEALGQPYPYHTDQEDQVVLCLANQSDSNQENPLPIIPVNPDEIKDGQPWVPVN